MAPTSRVSTNSYWEKENKEKLRSLGLYFLSHQKNVALRDAKEVLHNDKRSVLGSVRESRPTQVKGRFYIIVPPWSMVFTWSKRTTLRSVAFDGETTRSVHFFVNDFGKQLEEEALSLW